MSSAMMKVVDSVDSINVFGLWTYPSMCALSAYRQTERNSANLFVHSQGLLLPAALGHHPIRKQIASRLFVRKATAGIRGFIACNEIEVAHIRQWGAVAPIYKLPNPVTIRYIRSGGYRSRHGISENSPIVGYLNRFHPIKRVSELCDAFLEMQLRNKNIRFILAGDFNNAYGLAVKARAAAMGLKADFVGHLSGDEKWEFLADCTVLCQFSIQEGHSNAILEALAAGVPVVVSRGCNAPEVAQKNVGAIVDSVGELAAATIAIVENQRLRDEMSRNAKRLAEEEYSGDTWVRRFEDIVSTA
jgi:glycosyltransferase involved in cell wall biosynthesis